MTQDWLKEIIEYCSKYNIPLEYLAETMYEPKVVPMLRGKAFEFSAMMELQGILPKDEWEVTKEVMNAQLGFHDVDVKVLHKPTGITLRGECKLAQKEGYKFITAFLPEEYHEIRVKCMRSRTLGLSKVKALAPIFGVDEDVLAVHNDQYLPSDFDFVLCSIGNTFYRTDNSTGFFEWNPTELEKKFIKRFNPPNDVNLKDFAFHKMYLARSTDLAVSHSTGVVCTRRACNNKNNCGFIPDYPIIRFDESLKPINRWLPLGDSLDFFKKIVNSQTRK